MIHNDAGVDFIAEMKHETEYAYLFFDGLNKIWIAKSQILNMTRIKGRDWEISIPRWLAEEKEII
jgi:hypothetical protein